MVPRPIRETSSPPRLMCFIRKLLILVTLVPGDRTPGAEVMAGSRPSAHWGRDDGRDVRVVVCEGRGQLPVGVGLGAQKLGLMLEGLDSVGAGGPAQRRLV